jgi:hypothetical protein
MLSGAERMHRCYFLLIAMSDWLPCRDLKWGAEIHWHAMDL